MSLEAEITLRTTGEGKSCLVRERYKREDPLGIGHSLLGKEFRRSP